MSTLTLNLNAPYSFIFFILIGVFILFAYFIYRYTNPPIPKRLRLFLFVIRTLALSILIFMMTEPIASVTKSKVEEPIVALLLDNSASMNLKDGKEGISRIDLAKHIINGEINLKNNIEKISNLKLYSFSKNIKSVQNFSLVKPNGGSTNIGDVFYEVSDELSEENFNAMVIITDGANNSGRDPLRASQNLGVPVYAIGIGDPSEPMDVAITKFLTNEVAYINNKIPVEITIQTNGFNGEESTISLRENNKTIDSQSIKLTKNFSERKVVLYFTPKTEGLHKYTLTIPNQTGEKITQNNSRIFFVNVLKSKIKILYIDGAPNWDYSFIKKTLERDNIWLADSSSRKNPLAIAAATTGSLSVAATLIRTISSEENSIRLRSLRSVLSKAFSGVRSWIP